MPFGGGEHEAVVVKRAPSLLTSVAAARQLSGVTLPLACCAACSTASDATVLGLPLGEVTVKVAVAVAGNPAADTRSADGTGR